MMKTLRVPLCRMVWVVAMVVGARLPGPVVAQVGPEHQHVRMNQIQVIGSHNSYHVAPEPELMKLIAVAGRQVADSIDYTHPPLADQLEQGLRQFELDVYADPQGGLFAQPMGYQMLQEAGKQPEYVPNRGGQLEQPGLKVIHEPNFDYATRNETLVEALQEIDRWSRQNPAHVPILILIELKEKAAVASPLKLVPFGRAQLDQVDAEIRQVFQSERLILPDDLRRGRPTLREAIAELGWPTLGESKGKIFFALDNEGAIRDRYLEGNDALEGRAMLVSVAPDHPAAAFRKLNDPIRQYDEIRRSVEQGLIVRTRADANTVAARTNDPTQRERAFASGAQFVSTDYWRPDTRFSAYQVQLPAGDVFRVNPGAKVPR
jgi:hypothetical protein